MNAQAITKALGGDWNQNGKFGMVPGPGHRARDRSVKVTDGGDGVIVHSFAGEDWRDIKAAWVDMGLLEPWASCRAERPQPRRKRPPSPAPKPKRWSADVAEFWDLCDPLKGTLAQTYLRSRGAVVGDHPALRFRPDHQGWPCLVALVTEPATNQKISVQRTYIANDGSDKAPIDTPRKFWPGLESNGVVRLSRDETVTTGLAVAEGIETALNIAKVGWLPIWATLSAGNMKALPVLDGIDALTIFADHDASGRGMQAASALAERWRAAGRQVAIHCPEQQGMDWADVIGT